LSCQCRLHVLEKPEVRKCQVRTVGGWSPRIIEFSATKFSEAFERWARQLSPCKLSRRECGLRPSGNTTNTIGSKIQLRKYCVL
jgi:hypothetical protein